MSVQDSTSTIDPERTLGDLVNQLSARARVFERYGLDYCCHGQRSLKSAAQEANLDLNLIQADLLKLEPVSDPVAKLSPVELITHVEDAHHKYLWEELPMLEALANKVRSVHSMNHPELARVAELTTAVRTEMEPHLEDEEQNVFPAILAHLNEGAALDVAAINKLRSEHEAVGTLLAELRSVTNNYELPADACASYTILFQRLQEMEADTFRHIHLENNVLFVALSV